MPLPDWLPLGVKRHMRVAIGYLNRLLDNIINRAAPPARTRETCCRCCYCRSITREMVAA